MLVQCGPRRKNGLTAGVGLGDEQCALPEIVQHEAGQHEEQSRRAGSVVDRNVPYRRIRLRRRSRRAPPSRAPRTPTVLDASRVWPHSLATAPAARRGAARFPQRPNTPMERNHAAITGPNTRPTLPVPHHCTANKATITRTLIGKTYCRNSGAETSIPSTADSTDIAGVITPSPKNKQAPAMPTRSTHGEHACRPKRVAPMPSAREYHPRHGCRRAGPASRT